MTVTFRQPDNPAASHAVHIFMDGIVVAVLGPGASVTVNASDGPNAITARCGSFESTAIVDADSVVEVRWNIPRGEMSLSVKS